MRCTIWDSCLANRTLLLISTQRSEPASKSFHEKADPSQAGFLLLFEWSSMELICLCRHPSIYTLRGAMVRSVPVGRPQFSRCCYLIIDLGSHRFDRSRTRTWAKSNNGANPTAPVLPSTKNWNSRSQSGNISGTRSPREYRADCLQIGQLISWA
jgi:hypothetical protein